MVLSLTSRPRLESFRVFVQAAVALKGNVFMFHQNGPLCFLQELLHQMFGQSRTGGSLSAGRFTRHASNVLQHHGSRWARPRARLSARCQALFISSRASPQRFCTGASNTSLWRRSTCGHIITVKPHRVSGSQNTAHHIL